MLPMRFSAAIYATMYSAKYWRLIQEGRMRGRLILPYCENYGEIYDGFRWEIPEYYNIGVDVCDKHVGPRGNSVAMLFEDESGSKQEFTFRQIHELSNRFANVLAGWGCRAGDRVAILLPQRPETGIAHVAVYKLGAIAVPLSLLFGPDALQYRLMDSGSRAVITDAVGREKLAEVAGGLEKLERVYIVGTKAAPGELEFFHELEQASTHFTPAQTRADDPALIIYTSGTTGPPKGVLHAHRVLLGHLPGFELSHNYFPQPGDLFWTPADWAWAGGLLDSLLPAWHYGIPILGFRFSRKFDPEQAFWIIDRYGIQNTFLPPTALQFMRRVPHHPKVGRTKIRTIVTGGEPLEPELLAWGQEQFAITMNEIFGQTEANYIIGNCREIMAVKPGRMGLPYPGHCVEVVDDNCNVLREGTTGEIAVKKGTPVMFVEYWGNQEATRNKFDGEWMLTGDLAIRDEDNYFKYASRKDDIISSAGYRIGPTEVEACLLKHPAVALAAVVGVSDDMRGNVVKAFIQLSPGYPPSASLVQEIQAHVKRRLAAYEYPRLIEFVNEIPLTTTGKIKRDALRSNPTQTLNEE
jgi:acetyl-CoA synthetase